MAIQNQAAESNLRGIVEVIPVGIVTVDLLDYLVAGCGQTLDKFTGLGVIPTK